MYASKSTFPKKVVSKINSGYRMPTPRGCPPVVARIMKACWHADPTKRPSFLVITSLLTTRTSFISTTTKLKSDVELYY